MGDGGAYFFGVLTALNVINTNNLVLIYHLSFYAFYYSIFF